MKASENGKTKTSRQPEKRKPSSRQAGMMGIRQACGWRRADAWRNGLLKRIAPGH